MATDTTTSGIALLRMRWRVRGQVQGVGFRPFISQLAAAHKLSGFVLNDAAGVVIEAQGDPPQVQAFAEELKSQAPPLALIGQIDATQIDAIADEREFVIRSSNGNGKKQAGITVDTAVCADCLHELLGGENRRSGYGLINCTNCGPRYTIIRKVPYDRPNTTMAQFEMCPACRYEYGDAADRRYHAQPIACHRCGPRVTLVDNAGASIAGDAIGTAVRYLSQGRIVAVKGLGGFHLACRADNEAVVKRLRELKQRDCKPFGLMCASIEEVRKLVELSDAAEQLLCSPAAPLVLAKRKVAPGARPADAHAAAVADSVAPESHRLGIMLPYTPVHHLLFSDAQHPLTALVMTSANISDEPLVCENQEAVQRLGRMCDVILWHDRAIARAVDDSVLIDMGAADAPLPLRRARGYVPGGIPLPEGVASSPGVSLGAELKATVGVVRDGQVVLSQHLGDLVHPRTYAAYKFTIDDLCDLLDVKPKWVAHDLHPMYMSTTHASALAHRLGAVRVPVQHHHAHAASVMAEHGIGGPVLALVCDGTGYGTDKTVWGGELMLADLKSFKRLARLRPLRLAGGDAAAREPWRSALALLYQAYGDDFRTHPIMQRLMHGAHEGMWSRLGHAVGASDRMAHGDAAPPAASEHDVEMVTQMIAGNKSCIDSSGAGRVFDGIAALLGLCTHNHHEAQAAMRLVAVASDVEAPSVQQRTFEVLRGQGLPQLDLSPLVRHIVELQEQGAQPPALAALFHDQFARAWEALLLAGVDKTGVVRIALSGGVFCNQRLSNLLCHRLEERGLHVLRHELVPPNDGGIALGQAAIAAAMYAERIGA